VVAAGSSEIAHSLEDNGWWLLFPSAARPATAEQEACLLTHLELPVVELDPPEPFTS
jgi:hypothetical protein